MQLVMTPYPQGDQANQEQETANIKQKIGEISKPIWAENGIASFG